jgi:photosystem II stability/assembly factor-like uncharacterized protein
MRAYKLFSLCGLYCLVILLAIQPKSTLDLNKKYQDEHEEHEEYDDPLEFLAFHRGIRTADDEQSPSYKNGFKIKELSKSKAIARTRSSARAQSNGVLDWRERGPANVPGRTRGIIVDPDDLNRNTWYAGSASGGVWKTTNGGLLWTNITPDLSNLATTVLAMAESNHNIIYLGTGEGFGNVDNVSGSGIFKSTDRGVTWNLLTNTLNFDDINRIIVDPANENIVVAATNNGIYRSTDGGANWSKTYNSDGVQDIKSTPGNFQIQYAAKNGTGVLKSIDGGVTWNTSNVGMSPTGRVELAVSPVNTNRIFASAQGTKSGTNSDLYMSNDAGQTWSLIDANINGTVVNHLGNQGWYDNTIACDPYNADIIYIGGIGLFRVTLGTGSSNINVFSVQNDASFLDLVPATNFNQGQFQSTNLANVSIEIRFGDGVKQFAHRFEVPEGATSGVPDANYMYRDFIEIPLQVWDITNNKQLMVSFRDQDRNGKFNLKLRNTEGAAIDQSREYLYIHNINYNTSPNSSIAVNGGHVVNMMYNFWPVLAAGGTWDPDNTPLPTSKLRVSLTQIQKFNASTITVADVYNNFDGKNRFSNFGIDLHPDQHNIIMIPVNPSAKTYKILVANDGGLFLCNTSTQPGINQGDWSMRGNTYNTSQFYGADKRPGKDEYFGGMQDNGTWKSPANVQANSSTNYIYNIGGDGFEVLWHPLDDQKLIGGSQNNSFRKSTDGGNTWVAATSGLSGDHPFISKLAHSKSNPDVIFTVGSAGIFKSTNFGTSWSLTPITEKWMGSSATFLDVEVSRANANIIWAGGGISSSQNIYVSTNGGTSYTMTQNYNEVSLGRITRLASHPFEDSTAYAVFSFSDRPKILRTKNLGQSWEDISGFGTGNESTTGFPDVAVYCLYVRTDNPNIIWAGTEIGIVESLDNGATWALLEDFPNVSVWDFKGQDNQIVIATHGRGIWTATVNQPQVVVKDPVVVAFGTSPKEKLKLRIQLEEAFDSIDVFVNSSKVSTLRNLSVGTHIATLDNVLPGAKNVKLVSYKKTAPFHTKNFALTHHDIQSIKASHATYFTNTTDLFLQGFSQQSIAGATVAERKPIQTVHSYSNNANYILEVLHPIKVSNDYPILHYRDIALVEPGQTGFAFGTPEFTDYVVVEGSKDGLDWTPLEDGYDARYHANWLTAFNTSAVGNKSMFVAHEVDLTQKFLAGDSVLIRFRLHSNATITGWGWAIDYITIQQQPTGLPGETNSQSGVTVFPNPAQEQATIEYELASVSDVSYEIIDLFGRKVASKQLGRKPSGVYQERINTTAYQGGSYLVVINTSEGKKVTRLVISR